MSTNDYPRLSYSRTDVRLAGRKLAQPVIYTPETHREAVEAFSVAHAWRASHFYPMRSIRSTMAAYMRLGAIRGDMASRVKRMPSIRRKLADRDLDVSLDRMQDLGGCRAILDDIDGVKRLVDIVRGRIPHGVRREWHYIERPKPDGYRSHHFSLEFDPRRRQHEHYAGRLIELQIRTRLQHSWATSIEAVSLYRGKT
jgi:ppGpp synthetase/RelA/SpoT-type nucleotidyltranferase